MKLPLLKQSAPSAAGGPSAAKKKRPSLKKLGKKKLLALAAAAALVIGLGGRTLLGGGAQAAKTGDDGYTTAQVTRRDVTAVITGSDHHKYAVSDLCLIPRYAILDPTLSVGLPPHITAETGMDALTHAVEAYLSRFYNTGMTRALAESAVVTIFAHLERAYRDGASLEDRAAMLQASFDAGAAFTRASVGNVHAIAHTLGGLYGTPHGLANAVLLPLVLEDYGAAAYSRLARLAGLVGLPGETKETRAKAFIAEIRAMNARMGIPDHFDTIREEDIPLMSKWASQEANPVYPVPVIYDEARFARVIERARRSR